MPFKWLPEIETCCICIPSLRTAAAIIAVLALVTNPLLSWLMISHSYSLRVSCILSAASRTDVFDLNINNVISFGFGLNADLGVSCLTTSQEQEEVMNKVIKGLGWIVLLADVVYLITSVLFLLRIYRKPTRLIAKIFMISALISVALSAIYGVMYLIVCAIRGKGIALCYLILTFFDLGLWAYLLFVIRSYIKKELPTCDEHTDWRGFIRLFACCKRRESINVDENANRSAGRGHNLINTLRDYFHWIASLVSKKMQAGQQ